MSFRIPCALLVSLAFTSSVYAAQPPSNTQTQAPSEYTIQPWQDGQVPYHIAASAERYRSAINDAVTIWNRSGATIRLQEASSGLSIVGGEAREAGYSYGEATVGYSTGSYIKLYLSPEADRVVVAALIAHEFGHTLGLEHDDKACELMYAGLDSGCLDGLFFANDVYPCGIVTPQALAKTISIYGGKAPAYQRNCTLSGSPVPPPVKEETPKPEIKPEPPKSEPPPQAEPKPPVETPKPYKPVEMPKPSPNPAETPKPQIRSVKNLKAVGIGGRRVRMSWASTEAQVAYTISPGKSCNTVTKNAVVKVNSGKATMYAHKKGLHCIAVWAKSSEGKFSPRVQRLVRVR